MTAFSLVMLGKLFFLVVVFSFLQLLRLLSLFLIKKK